MTEAEGDTIANERARNVSRERLARILVQKTRESVLPGADTLANTGDFHEIWRSPGPLPLVAEATALGQASNAKIRHAADKLVSGAHLGRKGRVVPHVPN